MRRPPHAAPSAGLTRRQILQAGAAALAGACSPLASGAPSAGRATTGQVPALITRDVNRPAIAQGVQSGDVGSGRAIVWSRTDRPARMIVDYDTSDRFASPRRVRAPHALADTDYTARVELVGLPPGQRIVYRVRFEDLANPRAVSDEVVGSLPTAPRAPSDIRFVWTADTCGQGFGINPDWGGLRAYETMRRQQPDFMIHGGDTIYADAPIPAELRVEDGRVWKNVVTEAKSRIAETLDDFRGNYLYNLLDEHVRRFAAEVPQIWQWDDHEVLNNWSPGIHSPRSIDPKVRRLAERGLRAFLEYAPMRWHTPDEAGRVYRKIAYGPLLDIFVLDMRSYRGPNSAGHQTVEGADTALLGRAQIDWLVDGLGRSKATWKVIAADMPIGLPVDDGVDPRGRRRFEAVANGSGPARGRELEIAGLLSALKRRRVRNIVWLTGDVHYTAAHFYDPTKARFVDFDPFWEFVSGPIHAGGTFAGPPAPDDTFGLQVVYERWSHTPAASPYLGMLFFGLVTIDARTRALTVALKDVDAVTHFTKTLAPA